MRIKTDLPNIINFKQNGGIDNMNKHVNVTVRYAGKTQNYHHNYLPEELVSKVKADAMEKFTVDAKGADYCLQLGDKTLNDSQPLGEAGLKIGGEENILDLITKEDSDTDG